MSYLWKLDRGIEERMVVRKKREEKEFYPAIYISVVLRDVLFHADIHAI